METQMANRLSYSQVRLYSECAKRYEYHYVKKLREKVKSGALIFGSSMDKAFDFMAVKRDFGLAERAFDETMRTDTVHGQKVTVNMSEIFVYSKTDYDEEILTPTDRALILSRLNELGFNSLEDIYTIAKKKEGVGHWGLTKEERLAFGFANWTSLYRKGMHLLNTLWEEVIPNIKEVISTQKKIELANDNKDSVIGYADLLCRWIDGRLLLMDLKTSGRPYEQDSVATSQQLAIYDEALLQEGIKVDGYGYIVLLKTLKTTRNKVCKVCEFTPEAGSRHKTCNNEKTGKRCGGEWNETVTHKGEVQYVIDTIPERSKEIILDNVAEVNHAITQGVFPRNFNACEGKFGRCPYFSKCWKDDDKDLIKVN